MKRFTILSIVFLFVHGLIHAQTITTYAGNGLTGTSLEGVPATSTTAILPDDGAFDAAGNYYFGSVQTRVKRVTPAGIVSTVAGGGTTLGDNGPATAAALHFQGMHVDSAGNIYIADAYNFRLRKVDATTGIITTIAGTGTSGSTGNGGPATDAQMTPVDVITDSVGNIYVTDNGTVRKIDATTGIVSYVATMIGGFCFPDDYSYLYVAGLKIWRINMTTMAIDTIAGTGIATYNGDGLPATATNFRTYDMAISPTGLIYIGDYVCDRIRMIDAAGIMHNVAGTGVEGYNGDSIAATSAQIFDPQGLAFDKCGNLYVADDHNNRIRKIAFNPDCNTPSHVGVINVNDSKAINVYPNPVWNEVHVDGLNSTSEYTLYDLTGRQVMKGMLQPGSNKLNIQLLIQGIYTLQVQDGAGKREVWKVLKE